MRKLVIVTIIILFALPCFAASYGPTKSVSYTPRVYLSGFTGTNVTGEADVLAPILLRNDRNLFVYAHGRYGYEKPSWANNSGTGSFGLGYRQLDSDNAFFSSPVILGAYVLAEYSRTPDDHGAWLISPGVESLGSTYDLRINGYFPVSKHNWTTEGWADEFGNYDYISFSGHSMYDAKFIYHEESGPGGDAEIGRKLFTCHGTLVKGYLEGYGFSMKNNDDIWGGGGRITIQPNTYLELSLNDAYDEYKRNVFMAGIQVSLYDLFSRGDKHIDSNDLQRRLFDPLERNFAQLGSGSDLRVTGGPPGTSQGDGAVDGADSPEVIPAAGHSPAFVELKNIWFFKGDTTTTSSAANGTTITYDDGTFEHPFTAADFNQATLEHIRDITADMGFTSANLFFTGQGGFNSYTEDSPSVFVPIELYPNQNMWGRMGDEEGFQDPATGDNRPLFNGGLELDNGTYSIDSIQLVNENLISSKRALDIDNSTVNINNSVVRTEDSDATTTGIIKYYGIYAKDSTLNLNADNNISTVLTNVVGDNVTQVYGIWDQNSTVNIAGNDNTIAATIDDQNQTYAVDYNYAVYGIYGAGSAPRINITGNDNTISATAQSLNADLGGGIGALQVSGIRTSATSGNSAEINIAGNDNTIQAEGENSVTNAATMYTDSSIHGIIMSAATGATGSALNITGNGNAISATAHNIGASAFPTSVAYGVSLVRSTLDVSGIGTSFLASATADAKVSFIDLRSYGITASASTVDFSTGATGTTINVATHSPGGTLSSAVGATGINAISGSVLLINGLPYGALSNFDSGSPGGMITFTRSSSGTVPGDDDAKIDANGTVLAW